MNYVHFASNRSIRPFGLSPIACADGQQSVCNSWGCPAPQTKIITCPDGFRTSIPVGAQSFIDPCRGHQKPFTKQTCNCMPMKNKKPAACCAFRDTSKYNYVY